jgi:Cu/Zn superoxide dismutase
MRKPTSSKPAMWVGNWGTLLFEWWVRHLVRVLHCGGLPHHPRTVRVPALHLVAGMLMVISWAFRLDGGLPAWCDRTVGVGRDGQGGLPPDSFRTPQSHSFDGVALGAFLCPASRHPCAQTRNLSLAAVALAAVAAAAAVRGAVAAQSVASATCVLTDTVASPFQVSGVINFTETPAGDLTVAMSVTGLATGPHFYHVHMYGDVSSVDAMATGGHFIGDCNGCRPSGQLQEVGLLNNGVPLNVTSPTTPTLFTFTETVAKLRGNNTILGRSVVIHGDGVNSGTRVAQCVIGRMSETGTPGTCVERVWSVGVGGGGHGVFATTRSELYPRGGVVRAPIHVCVCANGVNEGWVGSSRPCCVCPPPPPLPFLAADVPPLTTAATCSFTSTVSTQSAPVSGTVVFTPATVGPVSGEWQPAAVLARHPFLSLASQAPFSHSCPRVPCMHVPVYRTCVRTRPPSPHHTPPAPPPRDSPPRTPQACTLRTTSRACPLVCTVSTCTPGATSPARPAAPWRVTSSATVWPPRAVPAPACRRSACCSTM